jgi:protocatechuate 3,4-dioxygenase, alpha subunit
MTQSNSILILALYRPQGRAACCAGVRGGSRKGLRSTKRADGEAANAADPVLALVAADRRATLMAKRKADGRPVYTFDIHLQGDNETVFFRI